MKKLKKLGLVSDDIDEKSLAAKDDDDVDGDDVGQEKDEPSATVVTTARGPDLDAFDR